MAAQSKSMIMGVAQPLFRLYLSISAGYLGSMLNCEVQDLLANNQYVRHFLCFLVLYLFIVIANGEDNEKGWNSQTYAPITIAIYLMFVLSTKMQLKMWLPFIILLMIAYAIDANRLDIGLQSDANPDGMSRSTWELMLTVEVVLAGAALLVFLIGVGLGVYQTRKDMGDKFGWMSLFLGPKSCNHSAPPATITAA